MTPIKAVTITREPGNGSRYKLTIVTDPDGGLIVTWPDCRWGAWASERLGGEIKPWTRLGKVDIKAIGTILDEVRVEWGAR